MLASARRIIEKALLYARLLKYEKDFHLPDSQHMLHEQAHGSDADPAAKAQGERFTTGFDEFYDVCI